MDDPLALVPSLTVMNGIEIGRRIPLTAGRTAVLGRSLEADFTFPDEPSLSRLHARIERADDHHTIIDLGSANGTQVNGVDITAAHVLAHGDVITCGALELRYEVPSAEEGGGPAPLPPPLELMGARPPRIRAVIASESRPLAATQEIRTVASPPAPQTEEAPAGPSTGDDVPAPAMEAVGDDAPPLPAGAVVAGPAAAAGRVVPPRLDGGPSAMAAPTWAAAEPVPAAHAAALGEDAVEAHAARERVPEEDLRVRPRLEPEHGEGLTAHVAPDVMDEKQTEPREQRAMVSSEPVPTEPAAASSEPFRTELPPAASETSSLGERGEADARAADREPADTAAETPSLPELLARVPLFYRLSAGQLAAISRKMGERRYAAGAEIVRQGEEGLSLYVILEGDVRVQRTGTSADEVDLATIGPGGFFGEMTLLDGLPRSATVVAVTDVRCALLPRWVLEDVIRGNPSVALDMLSVLSRRLRATERMLTA